MQWIGKVISVDDENEAGRIKVRLKDVDGHSDNISYAFPYLPKMFHVKPKVGEAVIVFCNNDNPKEQRFYLGPIISQPQHMYKDYYDYGALKMIGGRGNPDTSVSNIPETHGAFPSNEDIAICGRKNSDIILGDSDVRIRCGVKVVDKGDTSKISFNRENPTYIKMKYHESPVMVDKKVWNDSNGSFDETKSDTVESSLNLVGQEINLISTNSSNPYVNVSNTDLNLPNDKNNGNEGISDEELKKIINELHPLPYGDTLIKFLHILVKAFKNHTHKYHQLTPVPDSTFKALENFDLNTILSDNIRIN